MSGTWLSKRTWRTITPQHAGMFMAGLLTIAAIAVSVRSLPYGYHYPKQDYGRAVDFVEIEREQGDQVATVGVTGAMPILQYLGKSWRRIDNADQLRELREEGQQVWVIYTLTAYIAARQPALWSMLQKECDEINEFEGTVAGGAISVSRCAPVHKKAQG